MCKEVKNKPWWTPRLSKLNRSNIFHSNRIVVVENKIKENKDKSSKIVEKTIGV
jgi:hypothetical protein